MTFLDLPGVALDAVSGADLAVLGIPYGVPYPDPGLTAGCTEAPAAIRARSGRLARFVTHHDFELDGPMIPPGSSFRAVDAGDVPGTPDDGPGNHRAAETAVATILDGGAIPIILGGDDSISIPVLRAYADRGPLWIVQVDAHLDFRHEVDGVRDGYSSPMRRASELPHVAGIVQVGLRGVGSARPADVADARSRGNVLVTAAALHEHGVARALEHVPADAAVFIAFDCDGLDPSVMPAVSGLAPGGLSYHEAVALLRESVGRGRVVGAAFTELIPARDVNELSALVVVRLVTCLIGELARAIG
jgi:agmatinase